MCIITGFTYEITVSEIASLVTIARHGCLASAAGRMSTPRWRGGVYLCPEPSEWGRRRQVPLA
jgi:hypothetical protein